MMKWFFICLLVNSLNSDWLPRCHSLYFLKKPQINLNFFTNQRVALVYRLSLFWVMNSQLHRLSCNLSWCATSWPISWSHKNNKVSTFKRKDWKWLWNTEMLTILFFRIYDPIPILLSKVDLQSDPILSSSWEKDLRSDTFRSFSIL